MDKEQADKIKIERDTEVGDLYSDGHCEGAHHKICAENLAKWAYRRLETWPDLLTALEQIRDLETECCSRCEGNGRLYADGKAHLLSENAKTILCGNCGGSGQILPENAQEIAIAAIAKAKKEG